MVFHGGFSKGCRTCLQRRIKCDEGKPFCQRCAKSKRECLGYRDESTMLFRDESQAASGTVPRWQTRHARLSPPNNVRKSSRSPSIGDGLDVSHHKGAEQFVESGFLSALESDAALCAVPAITAVFEGKVAADSSLHAVREALAFALRAGRDRSDQSLVHKSRMQYGAAISSLAQDVQKLNHTSGNAGLLAIMLMPLAGSSMETAPNLAWWAAHVRAAEILVRQRGRTMGADKGSVQVLLTVRSLAILRCTATAKLFTDFIDDDDPNLLSWHDIPTEFTLNPAYNLLRLITPVPHLRYDVEALLTKPVSTETNLRALSLIERCQEVDQRLSLWEKNLPRNWKGTEVDYRAPQVLSDDPDLRTLLEWPNGGTVTTYRDQWVLFQHCTLNTYRAFLQSMILRCGAWLFGLPIEAQPPAVIGAAAGPLHVPLMEARDNLLDILDSICRSVHYHLGATPSQFRKPSIRNVHQLPHPVGGPLLLARHLWIANSIIIADQRHTAFVKTALRILSKRFGFGIAEHLARKDEMCPTPLFSVDPKHYSAEDEGAVSRDDAGIAESTTAEFQALAV